MPAKGLRQGACWENLLPGQRNQLLFKPPKLAVGAWKRQVFCSYSNGARLDISKGPVLLGFLSQKEDSSWAGGSLVVEHLPSMCGVMNLIFSTTNMHIQRSRGKEMETLLLRSPECSLGLASE